MFLYKELKTSDYSFVNADSWQKASVIGSVWGAFEIVAGSILHNLAIPLVAGTILAVMGVLIMISGARVFGGKGIFWRSALVCAALKTVSPSPVILSPMIGISLEGVLMELSVLALGPNIIGYMLGGGLAILSVLAFKVVRLLMIYGFDIVTAYESVFNITFSSESLSKSAHLLPIVFFIILYLIIGAVAAFAAYHGGNRIKKRFEQKNFILLPQGKNYKPPMTSGYKGGIGFLLFHIIWLAGFILIRNIIPSIYWISGGIIYLSLCIFRYGRVRKVLSRPTFWIVLILVSTISSVFILLGKNGNVSFGIEYVQYSFTILLRATVVIVAFSSIGIEIRSKGVARHFSRKTFSPLLNSYSQAQEALPSLISTFKDGSKVYKPFPVIESMFAHFTSKNEKHFDSSRVFIVTADRQGGKTTFMKEMVVAFEKNCIPVSGFLAEGIWDEHGKRSGFNLILLPSNKIIPLCNKTSVNWSQHLTYYFNPQATEAGVETLKNAPEKAIIFVDEIGLLELEGSIWADAFSNIITNKSNPIVISTRRTFLKQVVENWELSNATVIDASAECPEDYVKEITKKFLGE